jgi:uncharacterized protein (DUF952 family)
VILHVTSTARWMEAQQSGAYRGDTLASEGFIHCCLPRQLQHVLSTYFRGQSGLAALEIDETRVQPEIRWEGVADRFPHIYGPLNLDAVTGVTSVIAPPAGEADTQREAEHD